MNILNNFSVHYDTREMKTRNLCTANGYQQTEVTTPDTVCNFCVLPYIKGTSEPIKQILVNSGVKVAQTMGSLFRKP